MRPTSGTSQGLLCSVFAGRSVTLEDVVACYDGSADEETALLQARRRKTEQLKADRLARERRAAQSKRD